MASELIASGVIGANGVVTKSSSNVKASLVDQTIFLSVEGVTSNNIGDYFVLASNLASVPGGSFNMGQNGASLTISYLGPDGKTFTSTPITSFAVFKI